MNAQVAKTFGLKIPEEVVNYWKDKQPSLRSFAPGSFPLVVDWSNQDSQVKNQSVCGSCWAFAALALIENLSDEQDLSEQVIVSCATGDCNGGWYGDALKYVHDNGVPPEICYPYQASNGDCANACSAPEYLVYVANYDYYAHWGAPTENTVTDLKALLQQGPVCVSMLVPDDGIFESYSGGVYNYEGGPISPSRGHAVLVVGYDDNEQCFKAKNSWSNNWGENGYFRIAYDDVTDDVQFGGYACTASGVYLGQPTPVELASFEYRLKKNAVCLTWTTLSEKDNYGFEIQRKNEDEDFITIGFVKGFGTTTEPQFYQFFDGDLPVGNYHYRLCQVDFDGELHFGPELKVVIGAPETFNLSQNYPNPFNQKTEFKIELPSFAQQIDLSVYNLLGQKVKSLAGNGLAPGYYNLQWDGRDESGRDLPSGIYYLQLKCGNFEQIKRMVLVR